MIGNKLEIVSFIHCRLCLDEYKKEPELYKHISPADYSKTQSGYTDKGLQVWCRRHDCNITNIDFEGQRHPVNITRTKEDK